MANCAGCGCTCIVADEQGRPYPIGSDWDGNEAIIVPAVSGQCGLFEFVHGSTTCVEAIYPLVAVTDGIELTGAWVVLSEVDNAPVQVSLRVNGVQVGSLTVPAGQTKVKWPTSSGTFPIVLTEGQEVVTAILTAGTVEPAVSLQMSVCVPGTLTAAPGGATSFDCVDFIPNGTLGTGQTPTSIGVAATSTGLCFYAGATGNHDSLYLVAKDSSGVLGHRRIWPPDPSTAPWPLVAWDSGATGSPASPADTARPALAVDSATSRVTHRWNTVAGAWAPLAQSQPSRIELGQDGAHRPPTGALGYTFFRDAGTLKLDIAGVWTQHTGSALTFEVVDLTNTVRASGSISSGTRSVNLSSTIVVPAAGGLAVRITSTPSTPGVGLTVVGTFTPAA